MRGNRPFNRAGRLSGKGGGYPELRRKASGFTTFNQIDQLQQDVNTELLVRPVSPMTLTSELAWIRTGVKARNTLFPARFWSNQDEERDEFEDLPYTKPEIVNFSCGNREWAPNGEMIPRGTQVTDLYGIFEEMLPVVLSNGQITMETHTAELLGCGELTTLGPKRIGGGKTTYDNLPFFATNKLINPNRKKIGNFSNLFANTNIDRTGLVKMLDYLDATVGPDGQYQAFPGRNLIVVSTEDQFDRASVYLNGTIRAAAVGNAAASESNGGLKGRADLVKFTPLRNFNGGKGWYGFRIAPGKHRPIVVSIVEAIYAWIEGLNPSERSRTTRNVIRYGRRGRWGHGYLWPQLAAKGIER